jgi:hypothetical protein
MNKLAKQERPDSLLYRFGRAKMVRARSALGRADRCLHIQVNLSRSGAHMTNRQLHAHAASRAALAEFRGGSGAAHELVCDRRRDLQIRIRVRAVNAQA